MLRHVRAAMHAALLLCALALFLAGCGSARNSEREGGGGVARADDTALFAACVAACSEETSLALVTRTGCLAGCDQARRMVAFTGREYPSRRECLDALVQEELHRQDSIAAMYRWCDAKWTHLHNRKGCYRAADAFFAALGPQPVCGSDAAESALYDIALARAREKAEATPATPPAPEAAASAPSPTEAEAPRQVQHPPSAAAPPAPAGEEPAALPQGTPPATPASAGEARVVHTTQPAGPILPPPYVPEQAETTPAIHDTPKYQTAPAAMRRQPRSAPTGSAPAGPPAPAGKAAETQPASPPVAVPAPETPPATPVSATPRPPAEVAAPKSPSPAPPAAAPLPVTPASGPAERPASQPAGENTRRLDLPIPQETPQKSSGPSVLMPPVPSMLDQPYAAPTIIAPQVDPGPPPPARR